MRRYHQLDDRYQMKKESRYGSRKGHTVPSRLAVQHSREGRGAGNSVENSRDSQPEQGHDAGTNLPVYRRRHVPSLPKDGRGFPCSA
jgi:hypothetical protein